MAKTEVLVTKHRILERKDGAVYRTEELGEVWIPSSLPLYTELNDAGLYYVALSTSRIKELNFRTIRKIQSCPAFEFDGLGCECETLEEHVERVEG